MFIRNIKRDKTSFLINLVGLSTGLACALLIYLWVHDERSIDKFHEKDDRLFQVMLNMPGPNGINTFEYTPGLLAQALAEEIPEVEYAASVLPSGFFGSEGILSFENASLKANEQYVSKDYFNIFSYHLLQGDIHQVLKDNNSVIISDEIARKLFNTTENVVGKTIEWKREMFAVKLTGSYVISGIFEKPPSNSTGKFDLIFSYGLILDKLGKNLRKWSNENPHTYLILKEGTNIEQFNTKIKDFIKTKHTDSKNTLFVQQYSKKYLYGQYINGVQSGGRIVYVRLFCIIALFILVIACINFMNLSTAKSSGRIKEVGIKKALGAKRKSLIFQYLGESIILVFLSLFMAIILVEFFIPQFNEITGKHLSFSYNTNIILTFLGIALFTGLVSGSYPALYLSGFNLVTVLKGKLNISIGVLMARKGLVIFQFTISVILIVSVLVIYKQIEFIQTENLGFEKDNVINFKKEGKLDENLETFLAEIKKINGVVNASNSSCNLVGEYSQTTGGIRYEGWEDGAEFRFAHMDVNYDFFETLGIEIKEGRTFSIEYGSDTSKIIFNEAGIKVMGIKEPLGKTINNWRHYKQIIGVVKDFHFESLYNKVKPCFYRLMPPNYNYGNDIWVKIRAGTEKEIITNIEKLYEKFNPGLPFEFKFLDEEYQALYESENRVALLSRYFAGMAIIISCMGLFGLSAFTAQKRLKEIGIRKTNGAKTTEIMLLLTHDFSKWVIIAFIIACPVAWFILNKWLQNFAYRTNLSWWVFAAAGAVALAVALLTVSWQSWRAASRNPVEALRYE
ncbi:MAG: FtsX-like permease family protein [Bacteroidales bacterium]